MFLARGSRLDKEICTIDAAYLLHNDDVSPRRQWSAGEDPDSLSRAKASAKRPTGRSYADHSQSADPTLNEVWSSNSKAIHRSTVPMWQAYRRDQVCRQDPPACTSQVDCFGVEDR